MAEAPPPPPPPPVVAVAAPAQVRQGAWFLDAPFLRSAPLGLDVNPDNRFVLAVDPDGQGGQSGVLAGDMIVAVDGMAALTYQDFIALKGENAHRSTYIVRFFRPEPAVPGQAPGTVDVASAAPAAPAAPAATASSSSAGTSVDITLVDGPPVDVDSEEMVQWLEEVKEEYGKYAKAFHEVGIDRVSDLQELTSEVMDELDEELKKQGAKSVQIKNIKNAISENVKANNAGMEWLCAENPTFMC
jgi:hypothetical protein